MLTCVKKEPKTHKINNVDVNGGEVLVCVVLAKYDVLHTPSVGTSLKPIWNYPLCQVLNSTPTHELLDI